ncbi:MAG: SCO family protein [Sandaracinaceae bacterium]
MSLRAATWILAIALGASGVVASVGRASAQDGVPSAEGGPVSPDAPPGLENVGVDEHLGRSLPLDLRFRDHTGRVVRLGDLITGERPVVLNLVYHQCPTFCSLVLDGTVAALRQQAWTVGREVDVLTISIDPRDTPEIAADRRRRTLFRYSRPDAERGWHFLVAEHTQDEHDAIAHFGVDPTITRLADALGFRYQWVPRQGQFAHPGVTMLLTPEGRIARYLYGLELDPTDVRLGLLEASEGRSMSSVDRVILYCFRYDHEAQGYTLVAWRVMQVGGGLTALLLLTFLGTLWWRDLRRKKRTDATETEARSATASSPNLAGASRMNR